MMRLFPVGCIGVAFAVLGPGASAMHVGDQEFRCDGGWCADGNDRSVECFADGCTGPARGFPTIVRPTFDAGDWILDDEFVLGLAINGTSRAYPIGIITHFETVEDVVGGEPVLVTYCPLCASGIVWSRGEPGSGERFLNTGAIWMQDLVFYDASTQSWWTQIGGTALKGQRHGQALDLHRSAVMRWSAWAEAHPDTDVLIPPHHADGRAFVPYRPVTRIGVDDSAVLDRSTRVHGIVMDGRALAFSVPLMERLRVATMSLEGSDLVAAHYGGEVFVYQADGRRFSYRDEPPGLASDDGETFDIVTGVGDAGSMLVAVLGKTVFWRAWQDFHPDTHVFRPPDSAQDPGDASDFVAKPTHPLVWLVMAAVLVALVLAAWAGRGGR